jgi:hypothetical protein
MGCTSFNDIGGGDVGFDQTDICEVNGPANWTITGLGQDLVIHDRVDGGGGTLTLHGFGNITIKEKNGNRTLVVESDNKSVTIETVNGVGQTYLRNPGFKKIQSKNGTGNVYFKGFPPIVEAQNGTGTVKREQ